MMVTVVHSADSDGTALSCQYLLLSVRGATASSEQRDVYNSNYTVNVPNEVKT